MTMPSQHQQRLALIKPHLGRLILGLSMMLMAVAIQLFYPQAIAYFMDNLSNSPDSDWLISGALLMAGLFAIQGIATGLRGYLFQSIGHRIVMSIRRQLFGAILNQEMGFFDKSKVGELANRIAMDVEALQGALTTGLVSALRSGLIFVGGTVFLIILSPALSLLLLLITPCAILTGRYAGNLINDKFENIQTNLAKCSQVSYESIGNVRLIQGFNRQSSAQKSYQTTTEQALVHVLSCVRLFAGFQGGGMFLQYFVLLIMVVTGGLQVINGTMTIGELAGFIVYATMVAGSAGNMSSFWGEWMQALGATNNVFELLNREPNISQGSQKLTDPQGHIRFSRVNFCYPTRPEVKALNSLDLTINSGETVALVGASGSGKTTIANLILGHYQPQNGTLEFDGINATDLSIASIREQIAMVEQEPALFSGSIMDNIKFAARTEQCDEEEVLRAAKLANAHDFIMAFPDGYQTLMGDKGTQLSGGQKQRIAIARALLRNPTILILDEATSALDAKSEFEVQSALDNLMQNRTTIIIAHRLSTIAKAERVLVMEQGRIIQSGTHGALMKQSGMPYAELVQKQMLNNGIECK